MSCLSWLGRLGGAPAVSQAPTSAPLLQHHHAQVRLPDLNLAGSCKRLLSAWLLLLLVRAVAPDDASVNEQLAFRGRWGGAREGANYPNLSRYLLTVDIFLSQSECGRGLEGYR